MTMTGKRKTMDSLSRKERNLRVGPFWQQVQYKSWLQQLHGFEQSLNSLAANIALRQYAYQ